MTTDHETGARLERETLRGEVLGRTLVDEHVAMGLPGAAYWEPPERALAAGLDVAASGLRELRIAGVDTIVDTTPIGAGRDLLMIREASRRSGMRVIEAVGIAGEDQAPRAFSALSAVELADVYLRELELSRPDGDRPAVITVECAACPGEFDERAILAVAFAHAEAGASILARPGAGAALWLVGELLGRGIDPDRILVAGVDGPDAAWTELDALAKMGVRLGVTQIGTSQLADLARASLVAYGLKAWRPGQVSLATGSWGYWIGPDDGSHPTSPSGSLPGGFAAFAKFLPTLAQLGVGEEAVNQLLINPHDWLGF